MAVPGTSAGSKIYGYQKPPASIFDPLGENRAALMEHNLSPFLVAFKSIFSGTVTSLFLAFFDSTQVAGMLSKVIDHPFDTVKVRLQAQLLGAPSSGVQFNGVAHCLKMTVQTEGYAALYKVSNWC